jgi:peroxiredoxin
MPGLTAFWVSYAALWMLILFHTLVLLELVRRSSQQPMGSHGARIGKTTTYLESGTVAPILDATDARTGETVSTSLLRGRHAVLFFTTSGCPACKAAVSEIEDFRKGVGAHLILVCHGDASECVTFASEHLPDAYTLLDGEGVIGDRFGVNEVPMAVLLDEEWRVLRYGHPQPDTETEMAASDFGDKVRSATK